MNTNEMLCHACGDEFTIRPGKEPTDYCDDCAQLLVPMLLDELVNVQSIITAPPPNCSCHISPPCSDCVDYGAVREVLAGVTAAIAKTKAGIQ